MSVLQAKVLKDLAEEVENIIMSFEGLDPNNLPELCKKYKTLHEFTDNVEELLKILKEQRRKYSEEIIPVAFENNQVDSIKLAGRNFIVSQRLWASIPEEKREAGYAWLKENKYDGLIQETVNTQSLSSLMTNHLGELDEIKFDEDGNIVSGESKYPPKDAMNLTIKKYTSVRKA